MCIYLSIQALFALVLLGTTTVNGKPHLTEVDVIEEKDECLYAHNLLRDIHSTPHLKWDDELEEAAQKWAVHLALTNTFTHADGNFGENIWMMGPTKDPAACSSATSDWYKEIKQYNYKNPGYDSATGHFSQVVWDTSTRIGVGVAYMPEKRKTVIVARYFPAGNGGKYKAHVHISKNKHIPAVKELVPPQGHNFYHQQDLTLQAGVTPCKDIDRGCAGMKKNGYCTDPEYKGWMKDECYRTCGYCDANVPVPIDGGFSQWMVSSACSKSCGGGVMVKERQCNNPKPNKFGMPCIGVSKKSESCNTHPCGAGCPKKDIATDCKGQAVRGYCQSKAYGAYMKQKCYATCFCNVLSENAVSETLKVDCAQKNKKPDEECEEQARAGRCKGEYAAWMTKNCYATCFCKGKACRGKDLKSDCKQQANAGRCKGKYKAYMTQNCYASCFCP